MLRKFGLSQFDIRTCLVEGGVNEYAKSKEEMLYLKYLKNTCYPNLVAPYWSGEKMRRFCGSIPDGYQVDADDGKITLVYYNGCVQVLFNLWLLLLTYTSF